MKYHYYHVNNFHSLNECKAIYDFCMNNISKSIDDFPAIDVKKTSKVDYCYYGSVRDAVEKIKHMTLDINRQYFGFDLHEKSNFDTVNINTYTEDNRGEYDWHTDGTTDEIWDAKLTVILNLSFDSYTGGDFQLFLNKPTTITEFNSLGSLIIFPSFIHHRVLPVTQGKRITLSQWFLGPVLR